MTSAYPRPNDEGELLLLTELRQRLRREGYLHFGKGPISINRTQRKNLQDSRRLNNVANAGSSHSITDKPRTDRVRSTRKSGEQPSPLVTLLSKGFKVFKVCRDEKGKHFMLLDMPIGQLSLYRILYMGKPEESSPSAS